MRELKNLQESFIDFEKTDIAKSPLRILILGGLSEKKICKYEVSEEEIVSLMENKFKRLISRLFELGVNCSYVKIDKVILESEYEI